MLIKHVLFLQIKYIYLYNNLICLCLHVVQYIDVQPVRLPELEIKDITDTDKSASYIDMHLEIDSEGRLRTKIYDKRNDFNCPIVNFPKCM